jgi:hypothetical protein
MKARILEVGSVIGELSWRGFGLLLFILPSSAGVGAFVSGSWIIGVLTAWGTLMLGLVGAIGYAIATTGKASRLTVAVAAQDAVKKAQEESKDK